MQEYESLKKAGRQAGRVDCSAVTASDQFYKVDTGLSRTVGRRPAGPKHKEQQASCLLSFPPVSICLAVIWYIDLSVSVLCQCQLVLILSSLH